MILVRTSKEGVVDPDAIETAYAEMERIIANLVECYGIPHTRMTMRWSRPTVEAYRSEIVGWLEDYAMSFRRLPQKSSAGREDLRAFARARLDDEIRRILAGASPAVEESFKHLFA